MNNEFYEKRMELENTIFTVGYSPHTIESFIELLTKYEINAVADVRSQPYSKYKPEFSQDALKKKLLESSIYYVFMGKELGARREEAECYIDGKVSYDLVRKSKIFKKGIDRLLKGLKKYNIVLLCAEKDPIGCHRTILIARHLFDIGIDVSHLHSDGRIEKQSKLEERLLEQYQRNQKDLFFSTEELLKEAYHLQEDKIVFVKEGEE